MEPSSKRPLEPELRAALEAEVARAYDAKGFLGSDALRNATRGMILEAFNEFLSLDQPDQILAASMKAKTVAALFARIVGAAHGGDAALELLRTRGGDE